MFFGFIFNIYLNYTWLEEFTIEYKVALELNTTLNKYVK